jgi:hypothetical protein
MLSYNPGLARLGVAAESRDLRRLPRPTTPQEHHQEVPVPDWLTLAETVSEIQKLRVGSLYEARMEMFGELFTGMRKAKGVCDGIVREIEKGWFIGRIGEQGVDWPAPQCRSMALNIRK